MSELDNSTNSFKRPDDVLDGHGVVFGDTGRTEIIKKPKQRSSWLTHRPDDFVGGSGAALNAPKGPKKKLISGWIGGISGNGGSEEPRSVPMKTNSAGARFTYSTQSKTTESSQNPMSGNYSVAVHGGTGKSGLFNDSHDSLEDSNKSVEENASKQDRLMSISDLQFSPEPGDKKPVSMEGPAVPSLLGNDDDDDDDEPEEQVPKKRAPPRVKSLPTKMVRDHFAGTRQPEEPPAEETTTTTNIATPTVENPVRLGPVMYLNQEGTLHVTPDTIAFCPNNDTTTDITTSTTEWKLRSQIVDLKLKPPKMKLVFPSSWPVNERNPMLTFASKQAVVQAQQVLLPFLPKAKGNNKLDSSSRNRKSVSPERRKPASDDPFSRARTTSPSFARKTMEPPPPPPTEKEVLVEATTETTVEPPAAASCSKCAEHQATMVEQAQLIQQLQLEKDALQAQVTNATSSSGDDGANTNDQIKALQQENDDLKAQLLAKATNVAATSNGSSSDNNNNQKELMEENETLQLKLKAAVKRANHLTNKMNTIKMLLEQTDESDGDAVIRYK